MWIVPHLLKLYDKDGVLSVGDYGGWSVICLTVFTEHLLCVKPVGGSLFLLQEVLLTLGAPRGSFSSPRLFLHLSLCTSKRLGPCEHHRAPHPLEQWLPNPVEPQNVPQSSVTSQVPEALFPSACGRGACGSLPCQVSEPLLRPQSPKPGRFALRNEAPAFSGHILDHSTSLKTPLRICTYMFPSGPSVHRHCPGTSLLPPAHWFSCTSLSLTWRRVKPGKSCPSSHPFIGSFYTLEIGCFFGPVLIIWGNIFH